MSGRKSTNHTRANLGNHADQLNPNHHEYEHSRESGSARANDSFQVSDESARSVDSEELCDLQ